MKFYGWRVLATLWAVALVTQAFPNYGAGVINAAMATDLGLERSTLGLGFGLFVLTQGGTAPLIAWLVNRLGARLVIASGSVVITIAALALALLASEAWHYLLLFGLLMGTGSAVAGGIPLQTCTSLWFVRRRGLAMSIVMTASSLGGFIAAPLLGEMVSSAHDGWRAGWLCVAGLALLAGLVALFGVGDSPAKYGQVADGEQSNIETRARTGPVATDMPWRNTLKQPALWLSINAALAFNIVAFTLLAHLVPHLRGLGHSPQVAALALGCLSLVGVLGKLFGGLLSDRFGPRQVWVAALLMCVPGMLLLMDARSAWMVYLAALLVGGGAAASFVCWATLVANYFGAGSFASVMGLQMALLTPWAALAPYLVGLIYDSQGSYSPAFIAICIYTILSAAALLMARPPHIETIASNEEREQWVR